MGYPTPFNVYCDMSTDGGGWTIFQKRSGGSTQFYNTWTSYKNGFGNVYSEHWLGNDKIFFITAQGYYELRVDMSDFEGETRYAYYDFFSIGSEAELYRLSLGNYNGTAGDSLGYHNGAFFTTKDRNNGPSSNCAISYKGAWWYKSCHHSNLNGLYLGGPYDSFADGMVWYYWHGFYYSLKTTQMKIRCLSKTN